MNERTDKLIKSIEAAYPSECTADTTNPTDRDPTSLQESTLFVLEHLHQLYNKFKSQNSQVMQNPPTDSASNILKQANVVILDNRSHVPKHEHHKRM